MKPNTRIATAGAALALLVAPVTFASEGASHDAQSRKQATPCSCMAQHAHGANAEKKAEKRAEKAAQPSTPEHQLFTDQG